MCHSYTLPVANECMEENSGTRGGIVAQGSCARCRVDRHIGVASRIQSAVDLDMKEGCTDTAVGDRA